MNQFKKGIEDIRTIGLSTEEKRILHTHIMSRPIPSPYPQSIFVLFSRSWITYSVASLLIVALLGGSAAVAAEQSVPGDLLYPVKIKVTEPARDLLVQTPTEHARWESQKASRRLEEAAILAKNNELTPERSKDIEERFQEHARAASKALNTLAITEATSTIHDIGQEFDDTLVEHARALRATNNKRIEKSDESKKIASSSESQNDDDRDTSSLEKKIKEVRQQFREDELRARSERDRKERESDSNVSSHNRSPRQESERVKQVQEEDKGDGSRPDSGE